MTVLDNAVKHFQSINREMTKIEVPEWECEIFAKPMNMAQKSEVVSLYTENKIGQAVATKLYHMARDEEGRRLFARQDIDGLMKSADPDVMQRLASQMDIGPDLEAIEKN